MAVIFLVFFFLFCSNAGAGQDMAADFKEMTSAIKAVSPDSLSVRIVRPDLIVGPEEMTFVKVRQSRFIFQQENQAFKKALFHYKGIPVVFYDRANDMFAYIQRLPAGNFDELKEWVYERKPNFSEGTRLRWKIFGDLPQEDIFYWTKQGRLKKVKEIETREGFLELKIIEPASSYPLLIDPSLSWGQWLGDTEEGDLFALAVNGSSIYAGGDSYKSTGWNNQGSGTFAGEFNAGANPEAWVVKITDGGSSPTLSWGNGWGGITMMWEIL